MQRYRLISFREFSDKENSWHFSCSASVQCKAHSHQSKSTVTNQVQAPQMSSSSRSSSKRKATSACDESKEEDAQGDVFTAETVVRKIAPCHGVVADDGTISFSNNNGILRWNGTTISRIAGKAGKEGENGVQDGEGKEARFHQPRAVVKDEKYGTLFVADHGNGLIRAVNGKKVTTICDETGSPIQLKGVWCLVLSPGDRLLYAGCEGDAEETKRIHVVDLGDGPNEHGGYGVCSLDVLLEGGAHGMALSQDGRNLVVSEVHLHRIAVLQDVGRQGRSSGPISRGRMAYYISDPNIQFPRAIATAVDGSLVVCEGPVGGPHNIILMRLINGRYGDKKRLLTQCEGEYGPRGLVWNNGDVYVFDYNCIRKVHAGCIPPSTRDADFSKLTKPGELKLPAKGIASFLVGPEGRERIVSTAILFVRGGNYFRVLLDLSLIHI